jgi:hypothetical protein
VTGFAIGSPRADRLVRTFCFQDGTPHIQTVRRWLDANPDFAARYARAKDEGMDVLAEWAKDEATANVPPEQVQAARLAFDARRWYASKIAPRRYADKLDVKQEISGPGGGPLTLQVDVLVSMLLTPANLERLTDVEVESIRSAAAKVALPVPADPVIEGEAVPVEPSEGAGDS